MEELVKKGIFSISDLNNVRISIGEIVEEEEEWKEPMGPTPFPDVTDLRSWDHTLLNRHKPFYAPFCDMCCFCTFGKCDLTDGKRGACGIRIDAQQARFVLVACLMGTAAHLAHARHLVEHLIEKKGTDLPISLGPYVATEAPIMRTVCGAKPKVMGDLERALDYCEQQLAQCLSATHTGQEGAYIDFESKSLHIGIIDNLAKEIADIAQIVGYGFPKGDPEAPLVELGVGTVDLNKPVILAVGHNVIPCTDIVDYLDNKGIADDVEVCGICCTAHDLTRYAAKRKIIGHLAQQLYVIRAGIADVIMVDEQCVWTFTLEEAKKVGTPVIATNNKICYGLPDRTRDATMDVVTDLVTGTIPGVYVSDPEKAAAIAVETAIRVAPKRAKRKILPDKEEIVNEAKRCNYCKECQRACPNDLNIPKAVKAAADGKLKKLAALYEFCAGCGRCEQTCKREISPFNMIQVAAEYKIKAEKFKMRSGRGPILDTEIRNVGPGLTLGFIPGVIAFVGCPNYPGSYKDLAEMAEEFLKRNYIVVSSGCSAMDIARYKDEEGRTIYEKYPGAFDMANICNVGSCVANAHIVGAAIKVAHIFARRCLRGNFEEIADYIYNRLGACGIAWGAYSQKAASIATGCNRWGVPVIVGPHGSKAYRRLYLGRKDREEDWYVYNARDKGKPLFIGPAPEHLIYAAETREEAMVMAAKLCIRPSDNPRGRLIKLTNYIDLHVKYFGTLPDDWYMFVRDETELPITRRAELKKILEERGWKPAEIPGKIIDPTMLERFKLGKYSFI